MKSRIRAISPNWSHIAKVHCITTLATSKEGKCVSFSGVSMKSNPWETEFRKLVGPKSRIQLLRQVHGNTILEAPYSGDPIGDGLITNTPGIVCAVRSADCLPVAVTDSSGSEIGIAHAGWRGLRNGVIEALIERFGESSRRLFVWIGPSIAQKSFEVGADVKSALLERNPDFEGAFVFGKNGRFQADLVRIARLQLLSLGVPRENISGGDWDTFSDLRFHSARRDHERAGKMVTAIWLDPSY